jgi:molybdopterin-guanine dinucleotide biosynthesis protein A
MGSHGMDVSALVLCGGMSRRMGRSKALLPFGEEVLLQRMVRILAPMAWPIVVVAAPDQTLPELPPGVRIAHDPVQGRGPLQGLGAGLEALPDSTELVYATATDVPFFCPSWIGRLREHASNADIVIPTTNGHLHPLTALYRRAGVLPEINRRLAADQLRLQSLCDAVRTVVLDESAFRDIDPNLDTLQNLNTPEDYARALARVGLAAPPRCFEPSPERNYGPLPAE